MTLQMYQIEAIDEVFYVIAMDEKDSERILCQTEEIKPVEIESIKEMTSDEMKERTILANEDMDTPEMNLLDYYNSYVGSGEIVCSTLYDC